MEIRELITFLSLSESLNYQASAEELQYAPSTLKKHINNLEAELHVSLFVKEGRHIRTTPDASRFLKNARKLVADYYSAIESLSVDDQYETFCIAGCETNIISGLGEMIRSFSVRNPRIRVSNSISSNSSVPNLVKSGSVDLGFCFSMDSQPINGVNSFMLYREILHWMAPAGHPLLEKKKVHYEDFANQRIATQHDDCCFIAEGIREIRERGIYSVDILPMFLSNIRSFSEEMLKTQVIYLVPHSAVFELSKNYNLKMLDMEEEAIWIWNRAIYKSGISLPVTSRDFLGFCRKYADTKLSADPLSYSPFTM